jgi:hypothetical protein
MRRQPKRTGSAGRIKASIIPLCRFITTAMDLAMTAAAQRHGELIADLSAERAVLREAQMMGVCGPAAANQTRLFGHEPDVLLVTKAARRALRAAARARKTAVARMDLAMMVYRRCQRHFRTSPA